METNFEAVLVLATLGKTLVDVFKPLWDRDKWSGEFFLALGVGVLISAGSGIDLFTAAGVPLNFIPVLSPWLGIGLSGLVIGQGASIVHEVVKLLNAFRVERTNGL